jgi:hypothetical protein
MVLNGKLKNEHHSYRNIASGGLSWPYWGDAMSNTQDQELFDMEERERLVAIVKRVSLRYPDHQRRLDRIEELKSKFDSIDNSEDGEE